MSGDKAATLWSFAWRPQVCGSAQTASKGRFSAEFCARSLSRIFKCPDTSSVRLVRRSTSIGEWATRSEQMQKVSFVDAARITLTEATYIISGSRPTTGQMTPNFIACSVQLCGSALVRNPGERRYREMGRSASICDCVDDAKASGRRRRM
jgi:hypothetical protein